jgi:Arc/MetJ-type ribon-helix-helix transcriptional regulator
MTITLRPEQLKRIEGMVAAGEYPSVEAAVRHAVDLLLPLDSLDPAIVKPLLDEARAQIARGEGEPYEEVRANLAKRMKWLSGR